MKIELDDDTINQFAREDLQIFAMSILDDMRATVRTLAEKETEQAWASLIDATRKFDHLTEIIQDYQVSGKADWFPKLPGKKKKKKK